MSLESYTRTKRKKDSTQVLEHNASDTQTTMPNDVIGVVNRPRRSTNRATMQDVAKLAQVSASTVSLYLRDPSGVSEKRAKQIKHAIDELNYIPNLLAGGLATTQTKVICVIVPSLMNAFFAQTVSAMQRYLSTKGYHLLLGDANYDKVLEQELVRTFLAWSPTGLILTGAEHTDVCQRLLESTDVKVVQTWELSDNPQFYQVGFSHLDVGRVVANHLINLGCQSPVFIGAHLAKDSRAVDRGQGFIETWQNNKGIDVKVIDMPGQATPSTGVLAFNQILANHPETDAIFCSNDIIAMGVMMEANRQNIKIPEQIKIISFGDLPFAEVLSPALTTVRPPSDMIGKYAIDAILDPNSIKTKINLSFELVIRGSS